MQLPTDLRQIACELPPVLAKHFEYSGELGVTDELSPDDISSVQDMADNALSVYKVGERTDCLCVRVCVEMCAEMCALKSPLI